MDPRDLMEAMAAAKEVGDAAYEVVMDPTDTNKNRFQAAVLELNGLYPGVLPRTDAEPRDAGTPIVRTVVAGERSVSVGGDVGGHIITGDGNQAR